MTATLKPLPAILADDDPVGRRLLRHAVEAAGLQAFAFDNGTAAFEAALREDVSLILLDGDMPGMDGYEVCRRLRVEPRLAATPIVIMTGQEDHSAVTRAFEAGATDFIPKPVSFLLLPFRIEYMLRNTAREAQVRTLVEALPDRLWVATPEGTIRWAARQLLSAEELATQQRVQHSIWEVLDPSTGREQLRADLRSTAVDGIMRKFEYAQSEGDGVHHYELRLTRRAGGDVVVVQRETTERERAAERIERLAFFDTLTQLPNRQRGMDMAAHMLEQANASKSSVAFVHVDLNGFRRINDAFGYDVGDAILKLVAQKLHAALAQVESSGIKATLARFGGDEFMCLVAHAAAREWAREVAAAFCTALLHPLTYDRFEFQTTPSIGIASFPQDGADLATVLKHADTAMYHAKSAGGAHPVVLYDAALSNRQRSSAEMEVGIRRALTNGALRLHYQPKYRLVDGSLAGVEALARWLDPEHGEIAPTQFIPVAEESSLIIDLGAWVIRTACQQIRIWQDRGLTVPVAINVSAKELLYSDPAEILASEARAAGIPANLIEIEITESLMVRESKVVSTALSRFRQLGCRIALDDFGTGYSSMSYITRLRPDRIKIDRSFVHNVDTSAADAAIAAAILSLSRTLNLIVTAEGIERQGQLEWLRRRGCDEGQGYLFARAANGDRIDQWLRGPESGLSNPLDDEQASGTARLKLF